MTVSLSVVLPTYNYSRYIVDSVESVLSQLSSQDELVVIDDGSTDDTHKQLAGYIEAEKLNYYYQENAGVSVARNIGVSRAIGDYIIFLDADDQLLPGALDLFRRYVQQNPQCDLVSAGRVTVDQAGKRKTHLQPDIGGDCATNFVDYVIHKKYSLANGAVCIRRQTLLEHQFSPRLRVSEDFCLYAHLLANYAACSFPEPTVSIRKHGDSLRHQLDYYIQANEALVDILFDRQYLPETLLAYKRRFQCQRMLSFFRALYLGGRPADARAMYIRAIQCRPANLFRISYLRKFIRLLLN